MRMYLDTTAASRTASMTPSLFAVARTHVGNWLERRRRISQITLELDMHSDHGLADMGLSRGDIYAVARGLARRD